MSDPKKIVVVGAGASARLFVKNIKAKKVPTHVTVIQPNEFASIPWYQTMLLSKKDVFDNVTTYDKVPGSDETVYGVAVACADGSLSVQPLDKSKPVEQVPFDILVAATGIAFPTILGTPGQSKEERVQEIDQVANVVVSGKKVVIAGGGATGVEFAADILESIPEDKRKGAVTLICSGDRLINDQPEKYGERAKQVLEELGGEIIFNDRVSSHEDTTVSEEAFEVKLKSGKTLSCHAYIPSFARGANTGWLKSSEEGTPLPSDLLDDKGKVVVNEYLQSAVYDKLYAIGATSNRKEPSLFVNVDAQAQTVAANVANPNSSKQIGGPEHAMFQKIGTETFAMFMPENLPMPGICATICCEWCGFPCNLLCPCCCAAFVCGGVDPLTCGYCCGSPEGKGTANTLKMTKEKNIMPQNGNYVVKGKSSLGAPPESAPIERS